MDIIITSLQSWDITIGSNIVNIAQEISKSHRVLFVNYGLDRLTLMRRNNPTLIAKVKRAKEDPEHGLTRIHGQLWVLTPTVILESCSQVKPKFLFTYLNYLNGKRMAGVIREAIKKIGFSQYTLFTDNDLYRSFYLKDLLRPDRFIYYIRDYTITTPYYRIYGPFIEKILIGKADVVLTNSISLAQYAKPNNPNTHYVGQGCDTRSFNGEKSYPIPDDMKDIPHPIVGYTGALVKLRLDMELIGYLAKQRPGWSIVLVGPEDEYFRSSHMHHIPNVHFLGNKKPQELPQYIAACDVTFNPQAINEITIGNYPRKVDEYLAMGKPVVTTKTDAMMIFEAYVYLSSSHEEFLHQIDVALKENTEVLSHERIGFARSHSWEEHVKLIIQHIFGHVH